MDWLKRIHTAPPKVNLKAFDTGDDVRVWFKILEQGKERLGQFEGVVIRVRGAGPSKTFTVRRLTYGIGVERVFPVDAPIIERVEVLRHGKTKRSRLYFLRHVVKKTRLESADGPESPAAGKAALPSSTGSQPIDAEATAAGDRIQS